jgi:signal transduction histidine kinase
VRRPSKNHSYGARLGAGGSHTGAHRALLAVYIPDALPQDVALCLFRIAQEGLRNLHATGARQIEVSLRRLGGGLELAMKDDGAGFDAGQRRAGMSLGLSGMRQRVALLGGKIDM